jgi:hypothetical protein
LKFVFSESLYDDKSHIEVSRRAFLALSIAATSKSVLNSMNMNKAVARKVMGFGQGLYPVAHNDGSVTYEATAETNRIADEMAHYYWAYPGRIAMLLCSGRYQKTASRGKMTPPPEGVSEAAMKFKRLKTMWHIPEELLVVEDRSGSTFENLIESIEGGHLVPEEFTPDNPLAASVSECQSWRFGPIATQSLALQPGSLLRLRDGNLENSVFMHAQERVGYALTCLALAEVGAEPGNLKHTKQASKLFNDWTQSNVTALGKLCSPRALASLITTPDMPVAVY